VGNTGVLNMGTGLPMTGTATQTAGPTDVRNYTQVAIHLIWTGTPNGTFSVQGSNNHNQQDPSSDDWVSLPLSPAPTAAGSASSAMVNVSGLGFPWLRVSYTNTSGTGTFSCYVFGKE
jgi:hypothetical protein